MPRRERDFYPTPAWATAQLLERVPAVARAPDFLEPCVGAGDIADVLRQLGRPVVTNDLDPQWEADHHHHGGDELRMALEPYRPAWIVTNPPFSLQDNLLPRWLDWATEGMACLLRLSFWEPIIAHGLWLEENPPSDFLSVPRISFTGDGATDNVATAWYVWDKNATGQTMQTVSRDTAQRKGPAPVALEGMR